MDAVSSLRVMTDSMAAYNEGDFDRLAQLYAEDITWSSPWRGTSCEDRDDVFELFRWRRAGNGDLSIDEIRGLPGRVYVRGRIWPGGEPFFTVFAIADGKIVAAKDFSSREKAEATFVTRPKSA
jgi:ketosteroid isomerase-like protein